MWWKFSTDLMAANFEAQRVIALRVQKLSKGDAAAQTEAQRMVTEKFMASMEAATILATGGSTQKVLRRYRSLMRANSRRLSRKNSK